ncbi:gephyrin-like molybdotransferase Glp [uncultured Salinisphaera sp.]|uniref:molybdopterin molybdotransferase MoeA n=1 Tax=uncultured Salinisphaera sp. TaxID=359372 RepID=UPI0032B0FF41
MLQSSDPSDFRPTPDNKPMPLAEARARIVAAITPIRDCERVPLQAALHRVLGETVVSRIDVPGADNASMDGYGYAAADVAAAGDTLQIVGESLAGHPYDGSLGAGECIRIMTGAVVPADVDTVVMHENTRAEGRRLVVEQPPKAGSNIRAAGEDIAAGATVLAAGCYLRPADIAILASVGVSEVAVVHRPRVAFFSTGDELRPIDGPIEPGEIYDSNRHGLAALLAELGMEGIDLGVVGDSPEALRAAFRQAANYDAVVTSGGVSVGAADFVLDVLGEQGSVDFWRVAIKPGKPLAFGTLGNARFFGLPGNPVSTAVTFIQLVRPALVRMAGGHPALPIRLDLPTLADLRKSPGRENFLRARLVTTDAGQLAVDPIDHQGSGVMRSMSSADCFIVLPAAQQDVPAGEMVTVEPFAQTLWGHPPD